MADPVSWKVVERGWKVVGADGGDLGSVHEVLGDSTIDIFNGLSVTAGVLNRPRYVAAEHVAQIVEGEVRLALTRAQFERLDEFHEPPASIDVDSAEPSLVDRVADAFVDPETGPQRVTPWRRLLNRVFRREPRS